MEKLYTLKEAQELGTKIIQNRANELKNELVKAKNHNFTSNKKEINYV
ncbi:MAG: hypothetical protein Q8K30_04775 [Candidatus Gracilibacteria bacterium]|nr:hypothetical protein [Candidatus Gracilibacteria bacterium]MDP3381055.1 hypothetical protein [bacterium]